MTRRQILREVVFYSCGIAIYGTISVVCALSIRGWQASDTYFAASGIALFVLGLFLARRQGHLQAALADLETDEKITVLLSHAAALRDDDRFDSGFNAVGDAIACLPVLQFTTAKTRHYYSAAACAAMDELATAVRDRALYTSTETDRLITSTERVIEAIGRLPQSIQRDIDGVRQAAGVLLTVLKGNRQGTTPRLEGAPISVASFKSAIEDHVRVGLDFTRLNDADFCPRARVIREPELLIDWVSPWYYDADGNECDHRAEGATPIPLVTQDGGAIRPVPAPPSHAQQVAQIAESMRQGRPGPILVGCYRPFGRDVVVVIDGSHRLRAALAIGGPLHVVALILHGPDDPAILSDLDAIR